MKNRFGLSPNFFLSSHEDASLSTVTLLWYVRRKVAVTLSCSSLLTCHHNRVLFFCPMCLCICVCMHLCIVHMHLSMHKRLTRLLARTAWPDLVWELCVLEKGSVCICMSVWVCMFVVWLNNDWVDHVLSHFYWQVTRIVFVVLSQFTPASAFRLFSESHTAPGRASGSTKVSSVLHSGVYITETLFSLVPKLQWFFSIFLDVCFVLLSRPINVLLFLTN